MRAIDTNVLIRVLARDDARQAAAADAFVTDGAWVSHLALAQAVWVLHAVYTRNRSQIGEAVEMLLQHRELVIERPDIVATALAQFRDTSKVGFTDCLVVAIARAAGHPPLGTLDRALARIEGATGV